jgi:hypothetical protein
MQARPPWKTSQKILKKTPRLQQTAEVVKKMLKDGQYKER